MNRSCTSAPVLVMPHAIARVVAEDDEGRAGDGDAGDIQFGGDEVHLVPDAGQLNLQMRIVGEQRPAARRAAPGDDPVVRDAAPRTRVQPLEPVRPLMLAGRRSRRRMPSTARTP